MKLQLEVNQTAEEVQRKADSSNFGAGRVMVTPPIDEDYWLMRVRVSDRQSIIGFPKFGTIGIGFAIEEDWNTNLPYQCDAQEIYRHIQHNKGDPKIPKARCIEAIAMIQSEAHRLRGTDPAKDRII